MQDDKKAVKAFCLAAFFRLCTSVADNLSGFVFTQVSEVDQSIDGTVLVAVRNQRSKDLRDIKVKT
jgi:hypothetical protein